MLGTPTGVLPCSSSARHCVARSQHQRCASSRVVARALPSSERAPGVSPEQPFINVIPGSQWANGIPPVMGAHLMASGTVAPISTSKGAGLDVPPHMFTYPGAGAAQVQVYATPKAAAGGIAKQVAAAAQAAIKEKGSFTLVLSGGSLPDNLAALATAKGIEWDKWHVFWVDERNVPLDSKDSNYKGAHDAFLGKVPIPPAQIHAIQEHLPVEQAATNYEGRLIGLPSSILPRNQAGWPIFDLILLGIGPDGHVASLFPNTAQTATVTGWVLPVTNSPKPPPERITFTMPVINAGKEVWMVALGASKAEIVQRALEVQALPGALPAQLVRPTAGPLKWVLDVLSAQSLDIAEWDNSKAFPRNT